MRVDTYVEGCGKLGFENNGALDIHDENERTKDGRRVRSSFDMFSSVVRGGCWEEAV